jgi:alkylation response protein AidB-like acyl-CoA dehydrogenase
MPRRLRLGIGEDHNGLRGAQSLRRQIDDQMPLDKQYVNHVGTPTRVLRSAAVYATDVAVDVTRRVFRHAGGHALYTGSVIERCMRDMQAASQHVAVSQSSYELRGQALLGFTGLRAAD